jgi:hypothetical protein
LQSKGTQGSPMLTPSGASHYLMLLLVTTRLSCSNHTLGYSVRQHPHCAHSYARWPRHLHHTQQQLDRAAHLPAPLLTNCQPNCLLCYHLAAAPVGWNCTNSRSCRGSPARATMAPPSPAHHRQLAECHNQHNKYSQPCTHAPAHAMLHRSMVHQAPSYTRLPRSAAIYVYRLALPVQAAATTAVHLCMCVRAGCVQACPDPLGAVFFVMACPDLQGAAMTAAHLYMCVRWLLRSTRARSHLWLALCCVR